MPEVCSLLQFWLATLIKAFWDSLDFVGQTKSGIFFAFLVLLLTFIWLSKKHGWRDAMTHWYRTVGEGVVVAIVAWLLVFVCHFVGEPFHLQDDMRVRRDGVQQKLESAGWNLAACKSSLSTESVKADLLASQVTSQQGIIDSQQGTFNAQQRTFNAQQTTLSAQQTTMNSCMATIGELEKPEILKTLA